MVLGKCDGYSKLSESCFHSFIKLTDFNHCCNSYYILSNIYILDFLCNMYRDLVHRKNYCIHKYRK